MDDYSLSLCAPQNIQAEELSSVSQSLHMPQYKAKALFHFIANEQKDISKHTIASAGPHSGCTYLLLTQIDIFMPMYKLAGKQKRL